MSIGKAFENRIIHDMRRHGWWTYLTPNTKTGQPFDIIAISDCTGIALEIKHLDGYRFDLSRVESNQRIALQDFIDKGNDAFFVFGNEIEAYVANAEDILDCKEKSVDIRTFMAWSSWI